MKACNSTECSKYSSSWTAEVPRVYKNLKLDFDLIKLNFHLSVVHVFNFGKSITIRNRRMYFKPHFHHLILIDDMYKLEVIHFFLQSFSHNSLVTLLNVIKLRYQFIFSLRIKDSKQIFSTTEAIIV